jgi:hypothetical protein
MFIWFKLPYITDKFNTIQLTMIYDIIVNNKIKHILRNIPYKRAP